MLAWLMTRHIIRYTTQLNNPSMIILWTCVIWSFLRSGIDTHISYSNEFCWSMSSIVDCQWYETLEKRMIEILDSTDYYYCETQNTHYNLLVHMTCHCIIVFQFMFTRLELDTLFHHIWLLGLTVLLCIIVYTSPSLDTMFHPCKIICATISNFLIFVFTGLYLHDWAMSLWSYTRVTAYAHHLSSFYVFVRLLSDNPWTGMFRFRRLDRSGPLRGDSLHRKRGRSAVNHPRSAHFRPTREIPIL